MLDEDLDDSGDSEALPALAIGAIIELETYGDINEVDETDFVDEVEESCDFLTELDPDEILDVDDVASDVLFPSNSSLPPPHLHLAIAKRIEERSDLETVVIPAELKTEEVDVPCGFDDSSTSHHVLNCREEPVDAVVEKSSKLSEAPNALEGRISLDAGRWDSPDRSSANKTRAGGDAVQARIPDSGGVWSAVCVLMVAAVIVGMENLEDEFYDNVPQNTDARAITEGTQLIAFDAKAYPNDPDEDPGGLPNDGIPFAWIEDVGRDIYRQQDLPVADLIMDESRGSEDRGLNPDDSPIGEMVSVRFYREDDSELCCLREVGDGAVEAGGARWTIEWEIVCIDQRRIQGKIGKKPERRQSETVSVRFYREDDSELRCLREEGDEAVEAVAEEIIVEDVVGDESGDSSWVITTVDLIGGIPWILEAKVLGRWATLLSVDWTAFWRN
ncbi:hypothetical protein F5887DRAFT_921651 [Amanita rubescens]|nr:hypothetical protein F5887DRAFT_921651 [Amanita rubescens]